MTHGLLCLGVSHKTAPVALRERLSLPAGRANSITLELRAHEAISEAVAISTCNRTELYLVASDPVEAETAALATLSRQAGLRPTELLGHLYSIRGIDVAQHLFSVAAGLESMIVGEAEIQGQVKRAYELALVEGVTGPITNRLFRDALAAGKRARTETGIGRLRVSVSSVAVDLARGVVGELEHRRVLVIGAGENGELTAQALRERGVSTVFVANRRYDRAIGLAQRFGGHAVRFDDLPAELVEADIVVSSTGSPHTIFAREDLEVVMGQRAGRPLLLIDIAVPRDIEAGVRDLAGITLYDMDDLQREVARNLSGREAEAKRAQVLIEQEVGRFAEWLATLDVVPTIAALRARGEEIVQHVVRENAQHFDESDRERLEAMARSIVSRLLHEPTLRMKRAAEDGHFYAQLEAVRELFALRDGGDAPAEAQGERPAERRPAPGPISLEERRRARK